MVIVYRAVLGLRVLNPEAKLTRVGVMTASMQASGNFPASLMPILYTALNTLRTNLNTAIIAAGSGAPGSTSHMHEQERLLVSAWNFIRAHVENVANASADPKTVIESAGMTVATSSGNTPVTEITLTAMGNGTVQICVPRKQGEVAFEYQYSTDGSTWLPLDSSKLATVEFKNQTPGATIYFRFAAIGKTKGGYCQAKSIMVV
jgi:hypothetical protein